MQYNNIQRVQLPLPGTYRLEITTVNGATGTYSFDVSSIQDGPYAYTLGTVVSSNVPSAGEGIFADPGQVDTYTFTAPSNLLVNVDALSWPAGGAYWSLYGCRIKLKFLAATCNLIISDAFNCRLPERII